MSNEENRVLNTKFGNASISKGGYYQIASRKEGNYKKYLHRLIWEDHYNKPVPKGYDIHHINGNKLDNRIQNLQCVEHSLHISFHKKGKNHPMYGRTGENHPTYGRKHTEEELQKMSEAQSGENNPNAKYKLWDIKSVHYFKRNMFNRGRKPNPCKCFAAKYEGYDVPIGYFHDFVSPQIINDLVLDAIKEDKTGGLINDNV